MTKKDYVLIADTIKTTKEALADKKNVSVIYATLESLTNALSARLIVDNKRFDDDRFITACGFSQNHYHNENEPTFYQSTEKKWYCKKCGENVTDKEMELKITK